MSLLKKICLPLLISWGFFHVVNLSLVMFDPDGRTYSVLCALVESCPVLTKGSHNQANGLRTNENSMLLETTLWKHKRAVQISLESL